jgi:hypothetical protein
MKITPKILEGIYLTLAKCEPFTLWDLPPSEICKFEVVDDHTVMATYEYDETLSKCHIFCISKARCNHLDTVIRSMAHEMVHCSRHKSGKWHLHDATFKRRKMLVGTSLGFDGHEL